MKISELYEGTEDYSEFWDDEVLAPEDEDFEDESEASPEDPDQDKVPHILMQLKKAVDVEGNYPIKFKDGSQDKFPMGDIVAFIEMYMDAKPDLKDKMQSLGSESKENFKKIVNFSTKKLDETKKDACYHKVKSRYKVWPSAYASGALVQCRKKGAKNWGNKSKKD